MRHLLGEITVAAYVALTVALVAFGLAAAALGAVCVALNQ